MPDDADRRVRRVQLSPAGEALVQTISAQMAQAASLARLDDRRLESLQDILGDMLGR